MLLNNLWAYFYTMLHLFIKLLMFIQVRWVFIYKIETKHQYQLNLGSLSSLPSLFASDAVGLSDGRMEIVRFGPNWSSSSDIGLLNEPSLCVFVCVWLRSVVWKNIQGIIIRWQTAITGKTKVRTGFCSAIDGQTLNWRQNSRVHM